MQEMNGARLPARAMRFDLCVFCLVLLIAACRSVAAETNPLPTTAELKLTGPANLATLAERVRRHEPVTVAYLGGSITVGAGASSYPNNYYWKSRTAIAQAIAGHGGGAFTSYNAGIGGTGSAYGAFRVGAQLLVHKPDLLIVEFAVNDGGSGPQDAVDGMEGIVRQALQQNPSMGMVFLYTTTAKYEQEYYAKGVLPPAVIAHHRVATHYGIAEVHAGAAVHQGVEAGRFTSQTFFKDGTHPSDIGHACYAALLADVVCAALDQAAPAAAKPLPALLGSGHLEHARLDAITLVGSPEGWTANTKQWNWHGVAIWTCETTSKPIVFVAKGQGIQLVYSGKIRVRWSAGGKEMTQELTGAAGLPMPAGWAFPAAANPDGQTITVEVAAGPKVHGEVWGLFSIQTNRLTASHS